MSELILERVSHLDAFSGYPFRRWLISRALGRTTDTPELSTAPLSYVAYSSYVRALLAEVRWNDRIEERDGIVPDALAAVVLPAAS